MDQGDFQIIHIDAIWLATVPMDMRAGTDTRVVSVFGAAHTHTAYLFANKPATHLKVQVHDGLGIWLAARRLPKGHFVWPQASALNGTCRVMLSRAQLDALVLGLPWQRLGKAGIISMV